MADDEERAELDQALAEANVVRGGQVIAKAGELLLEQAEAEREPRARDSVVSMVITNAVMLSTALMTNRRTAAMVFSRKLRKALPARVVLTRVDSREKAGLAPQITAAPASPQVEQPAAAAAPREEPRAVVPDEILPPAGDLPAPLITPVEVAQAALEQSMGNESALKSAILKAMRKGRE